MYVVGLKNDSKATRWRPMKGDEDLATYSWQHAVCTFNKQNFLVDTLIRNAGVRIFVFDSEKFFK